MQRRAWQSGAYQKGYLVLETGEMYEGVWRGGQPRAGEVVFNTSHSGYEEIATDPSYYSQIMVMTAPMMGNYGVNKDFWESRQLWIEGFVALEVQDSVRDQSWQDRLVSCGIPILTDIDTRKVVMRLRSAGTPWGALVAADSPEQAFELAKILIQEKKKIDADWVYAVSRTETEVVKGKKTGGPRVAILDYGCKENTVRELADRCSEVALFNSRTPERVIREWNPSGIMLSNGPGDPSEVQQAASVVKGLLGWKPIFGICMGNQILAIALGAKTYKLKFGHRGSNHPVKDSLTQSIYVTSQNHGYAVDAQTLPSNVKVSHTNLNDQTVEGIQCVEKKCFSVQYHPESHPGPREARILFDYFVDSL